MGRRGTATSGNAELHADGLTLAQLNAVDALASGKNDTETAALVGVHRVTVTKWRRYSLPFQAALNRTRADLWGSGIDRLRSLLPKAMDTLGKLLEDGPPELRLKAALEVANLCPLTPEAFQPGPDNAEDLLTQVTMRRRLTVKTVNDENLFFRLGNNLPDMVMHRIMIQTELDRAMKTPDPSPELPAKIPTEIPATDIADPSQDA